MAKVVSPTRRKQAKFASMLGMLLYKFAVDKKPVVIVELYRDLATQKILVARGASKTMNSKHLEGLAVDLVFLDDIEDDGRVNYTAEMYKPYGEYWEGLGGMWGGRFGDDPSTEKVEGWDAGHFSL